MSDESYSIQWPDDYPDATVERLQDSAKRILPGMMTADEFKDRLVDIGMDSLAENIRPKADDAALTKIIAETIRKEHEAIWAIDRDMASAPHFLEGDLPAAVLDALKKAGALR